MQTEYDRLTKLNGDGKELQKALVEAFEFLQGHYGDHKKAAQALKISYPGYNNARYDPLSMPPRVQNYILLAVDALKHRSC